MDWSHNKTLGIAETDYLAIEWSVGEKNDRGITGFENSRYTVYIVIKDQGYESYVKMKWKVENQDEWRKATNSANQFTDCYNYRKRVWIMIFFKINNN